MPKHKATHRLVVAKEQYRMELESIQRTLRTAPAISRERPSHARTASTTTT